MVTYENNPTLIDTWAVEFETLPGPISCISNVQYTQQQMPKRQLGLLAALAKL